MQKKPTKFHDEFHSNVHITSMQPQPYITLVGLDMHPPPHPTPNTRGEDKVKRQGQGRINVRLKKANHNYNHNNNLMGFDTIEINLALWASPTFSFIRND